MKGDFDLKFLFCFVLSDIRYACVFFILSHQIKVKLEALQIMRSIFVWMLGLGLKENRNYAIKSEINCSRRILNQKLFEEKRAIITKHFFEFLRCSEAVHLVWPLSLDCVVT
jgi:hypothetical protein